MTYVVRAEPPSRSVIPAGLATLLATAVVALAVGSGALAGDEKGHAPRPAPPSESAQEAARKRIWNRHAEEYAGRTPEARWALGNKLFEAAREAIKAAPDAAPEDEGRVEQFAMLGEARDLAIAAQDADLAIKAIDVRARLYAIDPVAEKAKALGEAGPRTKTAPAMQAYAVQWLRLCEEAAAGDDFDAAEAASGRALAAARTFNDKAVALLVEERAASVRLAREAAERVAKARAVLTERPDDADANLAVGLYLCSRKGDWGEALAALAKGSDAATREAAKKDLAAAGRPPSAGEHINVGDLWLVLAKTQPEGEVAVREAFRRRARSWYETALPLLDDADRPAVLKRIEGLPAVVDFAAVTKAAEKTARTPAAGAPGGGDFEEVPGRGAVLVGFRATTTRFKDNEIVSSLQPVFSTPAGQTSGTISGTPRAEPKPVVAKEGYAVGGMVVAYGERMNGFEIIFMRIKGATLDPADSYTSDWLGSRGGERKTIGGDGKLAVGVHGRRGHDLDAVGLVCVE